MKPTPDYLTLAIKYLARTDRTVAQVERYVLEKGASRAEERLVVRELELACQALEGRASRTRPAQWVRFLRQRGFDDDTIQQVTQVDLETGLDEL